MKVQNAPLKAAALLAFVAAAAGIFAFYFSKAGGELELSRPYVVRASLPNTAGIVPESDVRRAGIKVGSVNELRRTGRLVEVEFALEDGQGPVYRNASVLPRIKTPAGEAYLELRVGTPAAGRVSDGGVLPVSRSDEAVQLEQVLSTLDRDTRARLRGAIGSLASGVDGRGGDLGRTFGGLRDAVDAGSPLMRILREQRRDLARLTSDTATVMGVLADRSASLQQLVRQGKVAAEAVADEQAAFGDTLDELPATLGKARRSVGRLAAFSGEAVPVLTDLRTAVRALGPVVSSLPSSAGELRRTGREIDPLRRQLTPLLRRLDQFARAARPALPPTRELLRQANPALQHLSKYDRELGTLPGKLGAATPIKGNPGWIGRLRALFSRPSLAGYTPEMKRAVDALFDTKLLQPLDGLGQNPYPKPGTIGNPQPFSGKYERIEPAP